MFSINDLDETLRFEVARTLRTNRPFCLLCIRAQRPNEEKMLDWHMIELNKALLDAIREIDRTFQTSPNEITVILMETPLSVAAKVAQRVIRAAIGSSVLREIMPRIYVGVAEFPSSANNAHTLFDLARKASEAAKQSGANDIEIVVAR